MSQVNVLCATWNCRSTLVSEPHDTTGGPMSTTIFDADSHLMETPDWLGQFADASVRERLAPMGFEGAGAGAAKLMASLPDLWASQREADIGPEVLRGPKGWMAPGALDGDVRSRVLDALGIEAQLVFPTFSTGHFAASRDPDVLYGGAEALNRAMVSFCASDPRLKAVGYLPLDSPERAVETLEAALDAGVAALWVPSDAPGSFSPTHVDLEPVWARLAEAGAPFVLHVGGGKLLPKAFHNNGRPRPKDWLGGGENLRSKDFPVLHHSPERFLACMVLDGVFERHPQLRAGAIELGASWVPGLLRNLDHAFRSFHKFEPVAGRAVASTLGLPAPPGALHAVPLRGHGLVGGAVRARALHVLDRLPASRGRQAALRGIRRGGGRLRPDDAGALLLAQRGRAARPGLSERVAP